METVCLLDNPVLDYAWGSRTIIPELLGHPSTGRPQAEMWMGAHPKAPSQVILPDAKIPLDEAVARQPAAVLGQAVVDKFGGRLPFLFKVLAAAAPLSIQAHPNREQARRGFERENRQGIALDAPHRNYRDANAKPECICALTPFWALNGFRSRRQAHILLTQACPHALAQTLAALEDASASQAWRRFFEDLMTLPRQRRKAAVAEAVISADALADASEPLRWVGILNRAYPEDIGILAPLYLNLVCLQPGEAMFLPAGQLHAYLEGAGIELMGNSDNVLRGGLTPKHIDVPELLKVLDFSSAQIRILHPVTAGEHISIYKTPAAEFLLSSVRIGPAKPYEEAAHPGVAIYLCMSGRATVTANDTDRSLDIRKGMSFIVPSAAAGFRIAGEAFFYRASTAPGKV